MLRNTRVAGHWLEAEGAAFREPTREERDGVSKRFARPLRIRQQGTAGVGFGWCGGCGARSPVVDSAAARRRWMDEHKAKVQAQQQDEEG